MSRAGDLYVALEFDASFDSAALQAFIQYLRAINFPHRFSEQGDKLVLWVYREQDVAVAKELFQRYVDNRLPDIPVAPVPARGNFNILHAPVSMVVMALCVIGFAAVMWGYWPLVSFLSFQGVEMASSGIHIVPPDIALQHIMDGQVWRLLTPAFLHFSWMHIGFNLALFWFMAQQLERLEGSIWLLSEVCLLAIMSNVLQFYLQPMSLFGGLSGVVYGLLAYCWLGLRLNPGFRLYLPQGLVLFSIIMMLVGFTGVTSLFGFGVANWAHLGGFLAGLLLAVIRHRKAGEAQ